MGDVDPGVADVAGHLTPVPGGVGPMTIAVLLGNTLRAARYRRGSLRFRTSDCYTPRRCISGRRLGARAVACF